MIQTIKTNKFKSLALVLAMILTVSGLMNKNTSTYAMEISKADILGFSDVNGSQDLQGALINAKIGVYIEAEEEDYKGENIQWIHNGTSWVLGENAKMVLYKENTQSISAYYPYNPKIGEDGDISYKLTKIQTADRMKQDDRLYAEKVSLTENATNLRMRHLMTKISITLSGEIANNVQDKDVTVKMKGLAASATFYPKTGEFTVSNDKTGETTLAKTGEKVFEGLVFPGTKGDLEVIVTIDGENFNCKVECPTDGLEQGCAYTMELQVGQNVIPLGTMTESIWTDGDSVNMETGNIQIPSESN